MGHLHKIDTPGLLKLRQQLRLWYQQYPGCLLFEEELTRITQLLSGAFGYHAVQMGSFWSEDILAGSRIPHKLIVEPDQSMLSAHPHHKICARFDSLPILSDGVDLVVLPHTLEFDPDPHEVLREAERILIPEGHLIIIGFNRASLWGICQLALSWNKSPPWCGQFIGLPRIKDWLALLGFSVKQTEIFFYRPPFKRVGLLNKLRFMERLGTRFGAMFGAGYVLLAKKKVVTLTPLKPRWRSKPSLIAPPVAGGVKRVG